MGWWDHGELEAHPSFVGLQPGGVLLQIFAELPSAPLGLTHIAYSPALYSLWYFSGSSINALIIYLHVFSLFCSSLWNIIGIQ